MRAVVFDFFGTLTDPAAESERRTTFGGTAAALGLPADRFWAAMSGSFPERIIGAYGGTREALRRVATEAGAAPGAEELDAAVRIHRAGAEPLRRPRPGALDLLDDLRRQGFRLGLISDCGSELVESWPSTPYASRLDAAVFSWQEGYRKPDARLYATAAARLGVPAAECWFVGDGGSREHQGARDAGMRGVLVTNAGYPRAAEHRSDPDTHVPEHVIDDLVELRAMVSGGAYEPASNAAGATGR